MGGEDALLQLLEPRRYEALSAYEGLLALEVIGDMVKVCLADLDVVAEDAVVSVAQGADAGALSFLALQLRQGAPDVAGQDARLIKGSGEAGLDDTSFSDCRSWIVGDRGAKEHTSFI